MEENKKEVEKSEEKTLIDKAEEIAKRIEEANLKAEELLKKQEEILTRRALSGKSEAGIKAKEVTEEEKINNSANKYLSFIGKI